MLAFIVCTACTFDGAAGADPDVTPRAYASRCRLLLANVVLAQKAARVNRTRRPMLSPGVLLYWRAISGSGASGNTAGSYGGGCATACGGGRRGNGACAVESACGSDKGNKGFAIDVVSGGVRRRMVTEV